MTRTPNLERSLRYLLAWAPAVEAARSALVQRTIPDAVLNAGTCHVGIPAASDRLRRRPAHQIFRLVPHPLRIDVHLNLWFVDRLPLFTDDESAPLRPA